MRHPLRLALAALGLAAAVYGAASLTGGWLGTPPWWKYTEVKGREDGSSWVEFLPNEGREAISALVIPGGLGLLVASILLREDSRASSRAARLVVAATGLAAAVYGAASLTGLWLGEPWWWAHWDSGTSLPGWVEHQTAVHLPYANREWISGAIVVAGLGLAAFALWPRESVFLPPAPPAV